jgi:hypothetical protein
LRAVSSRTGLDGEALVRSSRLAARVDNNAVADGFQLYLHAFIVNTQGDWTIVQQGMNDHAGMARRYHWHSASVRDFVSEPHSGIVGENQGMIMNLVDAQAGPAQQAMMQVVHEKPESVLRDARSICMPRHHDLREHDVDLKRLGAVLAVAYERDLRDFASLLLLEKLGPRTLQSLALVAEVVHGTSTRFSDPARFSFAHGGKDAHPFPVPLKTYDESVGVLRRAIDSAKLGDSDKVDGFRRLDAFVRSVEKRLAPEADLRQLVRHEQAISKSLGGRSVLDDRAEDKRKNGQLKLF